MPIKMNSCLFEGRKGENKLAEGRKKLPKEYLYKDDPRGKIAFTTNRPPVPFDIFSSPISPPSSNLDEQRMTDGKSHNYNGNDIPLEALKKLLTYTKLASHGNDDDVNLGRISGMVFISERHNHLELLHIAIHYNDNRSPPRVQIYSLADVFRRSQFSGVRMEDSGCFAGDDLIYVSTRRPVTKRCQPWTAVYKTNLKGGETHRLTPPGQADLNPSVSPSRKKIAVATFEGKGGWDGAIEDLKTDIYVMDVVEPFDRRMVIQNGGWPTWGSDKVIFFHRKDDNNYWGVYRVEIDSDCTIIVLPKRVTPDNIDAFTPAAIDATTVAVATIRQKSDFSDVCTPEQCRHIEIFYSNGKQPTQITQKTRPMDDHYNPFVFGKGDGKRIGYHCCTSGHIDDEEEVHRQIRTIPTPDPGIGLLGVGGGFPTFTKSGKRLAFVDNDFNTVWVLDNKGYYEALELNQDCIFPPVWNQLDSLDTLYVCIGPSFNADGTADICAIPNVSRGKRQLRYLTNGFNNAFPSSSPDGRRIVYRSTRDGYKNLYIMNAAIGVYKKDELLRLTNGDWTDTQCQWSPRGNWIVFSSNRDKPSHAPENNHGLDPGYFGIYLVNPERPEVVVRVIASETLGGHVNQPLFSPDGLSIVVSSDFAAVSVDPISLPSSSHLARAYGNIFTVDIDTVDILKNINLKKFNRMTHSRYENWACAWIGTLTGDTTAALNLLKTTVINLHNVEDIKMAAPTFIS